MKKIYPCVPVSINVEKTNIKQTDHSDFLWRFAAAANLIHASCVVSHGTWTAALFVVTDEYVT